MSTEIKELLVSVADPKSKAFSEKLIFTKKEILGVRSPDMKAILKRIMKGEFGMPLDLLDTLSDNTYEEISLQGGIIASLKGLAPADRMALIDIFVQKIDNWATCDSFIATSKFMGKEADSYWPHIAAYAKDETEFNIRYGVISMMTYYLDDKYIDKVLEIAVGIKNDAYYVKMAVAWLIATALAKYYDKTVKIIEQKSLEKWTHNKAIQKAVESFRITDEQKAYLRTCKIK